MPTCVALPAADVSVSGTTSASAVVSFVQPAYSTVVLQLAKPGQRIVHNGVAHVRSHQAASLKPKPAHPAHPSQRDGTAELHARCCMSLRLPDLLQASSSRPARSLDMCLIARVIRQMAMVPLQMRSFWLCWQPIRRRQETLSCSMPQDTYVANGANWKTNYGSAATLNVATSPSNQDQSSIAMLKFNLKQARLANAEICAARSASDSHTESVHGVFSTALDHAVKRCGGFSTHFH